MSLEALIFDVDGTLADTEEAHRQAFNDAFLAHGLDWDWSPALYSDLLAVTGGKERMARHIESLPVSRAGKDRLVQRIALIHGTKTELFAQCVRRGKIALRPGVARLIDEARAAGIRLAIASTTTPANVHALLAATLGPAAVSWLSVMATGDMVRNKKPAPDIYHLALETLGLAPGSCVAVEDSQVGVRAAKAAGLFTIATPTQWTSKQSFHEADLALDSLGDSSLPLRGESERRIGARWLSLARLEKLHTSAMRPSAAARTGS